MRPNATSNRHGAGGSMSLKPQLPLPGSDVRALRRDLADASDERVLEVLRMVDRLADRTRADGILAPLRNRLRAMRPTRPLCFARVLMTPLEPVLVEPRLWRPGAPQLPRNAIQAIVALTQTALPFIAAELDRMNAQPGAPANGTPWAAGRILWSDAAAVLRSSAVPPEWAASGLPNAAFQDLARGCASALAVAWDMQLLADPAIPAVELNETLTDLLVAAEPDGPVGWGMRLTMMLQRFPQAAAPLHAAAAKRGNRDMRQAAEMAMEAAWQWIAAAQDNLDTDNLADATPQLHRQITLLAELASDITHRRRATGLQADLRSASLERFEQALDSLLLTQLHNLAAAETAGDGLIGRLEHDARDLRHLEMECRRLGNGAALDARLNEAAGLIGRTRCLPAIDRARLIEILLGAQAALRLAGSP